MNHVKPPNSPSRRLTRLLVASWALFVVLAILNGTAVQLGWYCAVCR